MRSLTTLVTAAAVLCSAWGCERERAAAPAPPTRDLAASEADQGQAHTEAPSAQQNPRDTPGAGALIVAQSDRLPDAPARIVSLAPSVTEILFAIGAGDRVVGVTRFCDYPAEVAELPKVGGFIDPDLEAILARDAELVIGVAAGDAAVTQKLQRAGLPHVFLKMETFDATYRGIEAIGEVVGEADAAREVVAEMRREVHDIVAVSPEETPSVLFVMGHKPLIVAGPDTFGHEMITLSGARNAAGELEAPYPRLDIERVLEMNPDVIIDATMVSGQRPGDFWKAYDALTAVKRDRVVLFEDASLLRPGPRLVDALRAFKAAVHAAPDPAAP